MGLTPESFPISHSAYYALAHVMAASNGCVFGHPILRCGPAGGIPGMQPTLCCIGSLGRTSGNIGKLHCFDPVKHVRISAPELPVVGKAFFPHPRSSWKPADFPKVRSLGPKPRNSLSPAVPWAPGGRASTLFGARASP